MSRATLLIHPGALGDVLQAVPALRALRHDGRLAFAGQPRLGRLLRELALVDTAMSFDGLGLETLFTRDPAPASLVARLADFTRLISWFGARDTLYSERIRTLSRECTVAPPVPDDQSRLTVWQHLLATTGAASCAEVGPLDLPAPWRTEGHRVLAGLGVTPGRPVLMVHPGAGGRSKLWSVERHAQVVDLMIRTTGAQVIIHQGPADGEVTERLCGVLDHRPLKLVEPDLPLLAAVLGQVSVYLGADSGVSHLAAAVGAPSVVLFPAATRERWAPWSPTVHALAIDAEVDQVTAALRERMRGLEREAG